MNAPVIAFYFDFVSPYAYLSHDRLRSAARCHGATIDYHPVDLERLKALARNTAPKTREMPLKLRYARTDLKRWAALYNIELTPPAGYGSQRLNKAFFEARTMGRGPEYATFVWNQVWGKGRDMACPALLADAAEHFGWDADAFAASADSEAVAQHYESETLHAHEKGVFGVPTFIVESEMWWGNDRLFLLEEFLAEKPCSNGARQRPVEPVCRDFWLNYNWLT